MKLESRFMYLPRQAMSSLHLLISPDVVFRSQKCQYQVNKHCRSPGLLDYGRLRKYFLFTILKKCLDLDKGL